MTPPAATIGLPAADIAPVALRTIWRERLIVGALKRARLADAQAQRRTEVLDALRALGGWQDTWRVAQHAGLGIAATGAALRYLVGQGAAERQPGAAVYRCT